MLPTKIYFAILFLLTGVAFVGCTRIADEEAKLSGKEPEVKPTVTKSEEEWKEKLDDLQFCVLRQKATERAFSGKYDKFFESGSYACAGCGTVLFLSQTKYNSGSGWPAFFAPAADTAIATKSDYSHGMVRTEVLCATCGGHLGHVFEDGPEPTGLRYCINSVSLNFIPEKKK